MQLLKHNLYLVKIFFIIFMINCICFFIDFKYNFILGTDFFYQEAIMHQKQFDETRFLRFFSNVKNSYSYFILTYFILSLGHVYLYNRLWFSEKKTSKWLKIIKYIVGMNLVSVLIITIIDNVDSELLEYKFYFKNFSYSFLIALIFKHLVLFFIITSWAVTLFLKKPEVEKI